MTALDRARALIRERRAFPRNSLDWNYRTRAARKLIWMARGYPTKDWPA